MLIEKRNNCTYKLTYENGMFSVVLYPHGKGKISTASYREDALPEWVRSHIRVLDTAGSGYGVPNIGKKVGETYWLSDESDGPFVNLLIAVVESYKAQSPNHFGDSNDLRS